MIDLEKYNNYVQSETPNRKLIADIIQEVRGNRSAATYAADIGLNPTRISRIVNGNYTNALEMDTLVKLADGDEKYFERLLSANGMLSPEEMEQKNRRNNRREMEATREAMENKSRTVIISEVLSRGLSIKQIDTFLPVGSLINARSICDFAYSVTDKNGDYIKWYFEVIFNKMNATINKENLPYFRARVATSLYSRANIFLTDSWYPERLIGCKYSFVFFDEFVMAEFESLIPKEKLNNRFSLILVNLDELKVVKEVILKGDDDIHVFEWDVINTQQKDSCVGEFDEEYMGV